MDTLQFNKAVSQHCKESGGDCCKCDLRLYCYLSPSERPAASFPCIDDMDMSTAVGGDRYQKPHTLHKQSRVCESCGNDTVV